jgi:hypothetical protein
MANPANASPDIGPNQLTENSNTLFSLAWMQQK